MICLSMSELIRALDDVPNAQHLEFALTSVPYQSAVGFKRWERKAAAEALIKFYRGKAAEYFERERRSRRGFATNGRWHQLREQYLENARSVEETLMRWRAEENECEQRAM